MLLNDRARAPYESRFPLGKALAALVLLLALGALYLWCTGQERRALTRMPAEERQVIFRRELEAFRSLCGDRPRTDALRPECARRATFLVQFPECDHVCRTLARPHLPGATR